MKILSLREIIKLDQVEHVKNERNILQQLDHPFLLSLTWSCRDKNYIYLIFPYVSQTRETLVNMTSWSTLRRSVVESSSLTSGATASSTWIRLCSTSQRSSLPSPTSTLSTSSTGSESVVDLLPKCCVLTSVKYQGPEAREHSAGQVRPRSDNRPGFLPSYRG